MKKTQWGYEWNEVGRRGAEYIYIGDNRTINRTVQPRPGLLLDVDKDGRLIGVEILSAPPKKLKKLKRFDREDWGFLFVLVIMVIGLILWPLWNYITHLIK